LTKEQHLAPFLSLSAKGKPKTKNKNKNKTKQNDIYATKHQNNKKTVNEGTPRSLQLVRADFGNCFAP
jgi:hypothetical protein